uniref:Uncharacterized protein n=1 Tax=viral metagenome TaxID=1070528 RepID=A0A6M3K207_9ZZZZ
MYALIVFDLSKVAKDYEDAHAVAFQIKNFLDELSHSIELTTGDEKILESAFLFDVGNGLTNLRHMIANLERRNVPYKVLFLNDKPNFTT